MTRRAIKLGLVAATAIFSLSLASGTRAADVNAMAATCSLCHGKDGASTNAAVPIIGGMSATYLVEIVTAYKNKEVPCPKGSPMCEAVKSLSDADIKQVADYFAKQKFVRASQPADAALAATGQKIHQQNCEKCHTNSGSLAADDAGILAGQWTSYLKEQLSEVKADTRKLDRKMKVVVDRLESADIDALLSYYASVK